jgi:hypothetical protein
MDWTAIGAIGELLGAAAVVASLLYVGRQVQLNARAFRDEAQRNAIEAVREISLEFVRDPILMTLVGRGGKDASSLDAEERQRFFFTMYNALKSFEQAHYQFAQGELDEDTWSGLRVVIQTYVTTPGAQAYWSERQAMFSRRFALLVDELVEEGRGLPTVADMVDKDQSAKAAT